MPWSRFSGTLSSPNVDVVIDMENPFLNRSIDGFLKAGVVGASKVAAEETYDCVKRGSISKAKVEDAVSSISGLDFILLSKIVYTLDGIVCFVKQSSVYPGWDSVTFAF